MSRTVPTARPPPEIITKKNADDLMVGQMIAQYVCLLGLGDNG